MFVLFLESIGKKKYFLHQSPAQFDKRTETIHFHERYDPTGALGKTFYTLLYDETKEISTLYKVELISSSPSEESSECKIKIKEKLKEFPKEQALFRIDEDEQKLVLAE